GPGRRVRIVAIAPGPGAPLARVPDFPRRRGARRDRRQDPTAFTGAGGEVPPAMADLLRHPGGIAGQPRAGRGTRCLPRTVDDPAGAALAGRVVVPGGGSLGTASRKARTGRRATA